MIKSTYIRRDRYIDNIKMHFKVHPVCALLGPRQCGKTTLAHFYAKTTQQATNIYHFDMEDPHHHAQLDNPKLSLEPLEGLIIIDEIQLRPHLFPYLRVLADKKPHCQYLIRH